MCQAQVAVGRNYPGCTLTKNTSLFPSGGAVTPCALRVGLPQPCCCYSASLPSDSYSAHYTDHFVSLWTSIH